MATLQVTEALEMPGGFTAKCIQHETVVPSFVKLVHCSSPFKTS